MFATTNLVGLGQQNMRGHAAAECITQHTLIEFAHGVAYIHHHDQAGQCLTRMKEFIDEFLPVHAQIFRHLGIAIARQIDQMFFRRHLEIDQLLGATGGFRGARQTVLVAQGIQGTGFTGIRAACEGDFEAGVGRQLTW